MIRKQTVLCVMLMMISVSFLFSHSGPDEPLVVLTENDPFTPLVDQEWKIIFYVDHPEANNVSVKIPVLPNEYIRLDRVRTEPYLMPSANISGETWTRVEIFFIPLKAGHLILQPFEIITPEKTASTSQMFFRIETVDGAYSTRPELYWDAPSASIHAGQAKELLLRVQNNKSQKPFGDSFPVAITIPEKAIIERIPLNAEDRRRNGILRLKIIPLEEGTLTINPVTVEYDALSLVSPSLRLRVIKNERTAVQASAGLPGEERNYELRDEVSHEETEKPPSYPEYFPFPFKRQYDVIIDNINVLWNSGEKVKALAEIRKAERDLLTGYALRPVRKHFEQKMELGLTEDETYLPILFLCVLSLVFLIVAVILFIKLIFFKKKHGSLFFFSILGSIVLVIGITGVLLYTQDSGKSAARQVVLYETEAYRVPEMSGGTSGSFKEGESGIIRSVAGDWVYIETGSGKAGWVLRDYVIRY